MAETYPNRFYMHAAQTDRLVNGSATSTLPTIWSRLEEKGFVAARVGEPTAERGGRRKTYYTLTAAGRRSLRQSVEVLRRMARGLDLGLDTP